MNTAIFAAGCFWGVEEAFMGFSGVIATEVGYTGGHPPAGGENPTYEQVCEGNTGHAEAVKITFDPTKVTYETLVRKFFKIHDPTTLNQQGPDIGDQYRSVIFYLDPEQKAMAEKIKNELEWSKVYSKPIVTEITPASTWYKAEEYHQQYNEKRGGTCQI